MAEGDEFEAEAQRILDLLQLQHGAHEDGGASGELPGNQANQGLRSNRRTRSALWEVQQEVGQQAQASPSMALRVCSQ